MISRWKRRLTVLSVLLMGCTAGAADLRADPLVFNGTYFLIDSLPTRLDLFSNQGVVLEPRTYDGTLPLSLVFGVFVNHEGGQSFTDIIRFTYQEEGAAPIIFSRDFTTGTQPVNLGFGELFEPVRRTGTPIPTTLRIELLNSSPDFVIPGGPDQGQLVDSYTYSFSTLAPVPEPSTLMLLLGGIAALSSRRRLSRAPSDPARDHQT